MERKFVPAPGNEDAGVQATGRIKLRGMGEKRKERKKSGR
jgi:hypothetical protein